MNNELIQLDRAKYWDKAWNPVIGCRPISPGCDNCYALASQKQYKKPTEPYCSKSVKPPKMKDGEVLFVGNMTDLFGTWNEDETILEWLKSLSENVVNLVLTKRAANMAYLKREIVFEERIFWGVTTESEGTLLNRRRDIFRLIDSGAKTWLSLEPLLSSIDMDYVFADWIVTRGEYEPNNYCDRLPCWVVVGCESGPKRRPCKIEWVESIVAQCRDAGVPVFVKQLNIGGKCETDIAKFPAHLQIRQVPWEVGK